MKLNQKIYIIDRNARVYNKRELDKTSMVQEVEIVRETRQSFFILYSGTEYRYDKKREMLVAKSNSGLFGIEARVYLTQREAEESLEPPKKEKKEEKNKNYTSIQCNDGTEVKLEHRYLDEEFLDTAIEYAQDKGNFPHVMNTFFTAEAVKFYIKETGKQPVYEE